MFVTQNFVRMHDVDMTGVLYFPRQFRFIHEALEDFLASEGFSFSRIFGSKEGHFFLIVHCEANYMAPVRMGDSLEVRVYVGHIGTTSFTLCYNIYNQSGLEVGSAKTVHVTVLKSTHTKEPIPDYMRKMLEKHYSVPPTRGRSTEH